MNKKVIIYGLSGMGVDSRVFVNLSLENELVVLDWIAPQKNERIRHYANRLSQKIDATQPFILVGVSFGGIMAIEIAKIIEPKAIILISSAQTKSELRKIYRFLGRVHLMKIVPKTMLHPPAWLLQIFLGTAKRAMVKEILNDMEADFTHWALSELMKWDHDEVMKNCIKISGSRDLLMPLRKSKNNSVIKGGTHFMIVDRANEVSMLINNIIKSFQNF